MQLSNTHHTILITILVLTMHVGKAQHASILNRFTIDYIKGCTGMSVVITTNPGWTGVQYWYNGFNTSVAGDASGTHVYTSSGDFYVTQLVSNSVDQKLDSILVTVISPDKPDFTIHNCAGYKTRVEIKGNKYDTYLVEYSVVDAENVLPLSFSNEYEYLATGSYRINVSGQFIGGYNTTCGTSNKGFTTIPSISAPILNSVETIKEAIDGSIQLGHDLGDNTIYNLETSLNGTDNYQFSTEAIGATTIIPTVNSLDAYHCYKINTYDACNDLTINSGTICSVFFDVSGTKEANTITWQTDTIEAVSYNIIRNGDLLTNIKNTSTTLYDDKEVICNKEYVYNVQPLFAVGSSVSVDTAVIANKSESLPAVGYPSSTVLFNEVVLTWGSPDTGEIPFRRYIIEKNIRDRSWKSYDTSEDTTYTDTETNFIGKHAYRIRYDDDCGNIATPSPATAPMIIEQGLVRGQIVNFSWSKYETWLNGIRNYTIEYVDSTGALIDEFSVLSGREKAVEFSVNDSEVKMIRVKAESLDPVPRFTYSNVIVTQIATEMFLPNVFTPDNDGINDKFVAKGPKVFNFKMEIYSRWGSLIFVTTDNFNGWNGTINGTDVPEGTYIYKIYYEDAEMRKYDKSGSLLLLRKG